MAKSKEQSENKEKTQEVKRYADFDKDGICRGFYASDIHGNNIPSGAVEITEEQWKECLENDGRRKWDAKKKELVVIEPPEVKMTKAEKAEHALFKSNGVKAILTAVLDGFEKLEKDGQTFPASTNKVLQAWKDAKSEA